MTAYELPAVYLKPGEIRFTKTFSRIITMLGSCISVVMYNQGKGIGAMCLSVMPYNNIKSAIEWMVSRFDQIGIRGEEIEVKIYGGVEIYLEDNSCRDITACRNNIDAAVKFIEGKRMGIKEWKVGGNMDRKLIFNSLTGDVTMKCVTKIYQPGRASDGKNPARGRRKTPSVTY